MENRQNILRAARSLNNASVPSDENNRGTIYAFQNTKKEKKAYLFKPASGEFSCKVYAYPLLQCNRGQPKVLFNDFQMQPFLYHVFRQIILNVTENKSTGTTRWCSNS